MSVDDRNNILEWVNQMLTCIKSAPKHQVLKPGAGVEDQSCVELVSQATKLEHGDVLKEQSCMDLVFQAIFRISQACEHECFHILEILDNARIPSPTISLPHPCDICKQEFSSKKELKQHMKIHIKLERPGFVCSICDRNCFSTARLQRHLRTHTGLKPFVCEDCGAQYQQLNDLVRHQRKHSGSLGGVRCTVQGCGKLLGTNNALTVHNRIHTGEKSYFCKTCSKTFRTNSSLRRHNLIHTGDRPFRCTACRKSFQTSSHLNVHMKIHQGQAKTVLISEPVNPVQP